MSTRESYYGGKVIILLLFGLGFLYHIFISSPKKKAKQEQEIIDVWGSNTANYFKNFTCVGLSYYEKEHYVDKFIVVESDVDKDCELKKYSPFEEKTMKIDFDKFSKYTKNIDEANTIIWIKTKLGEVEAKYGREKEGIRLISEINFIDKQTKSIYKKVDVKHKGRVPEEVLIKRSNAGKPVYIGNRDRETIENIIWQSIK